MTTAGRASIERVEQFVHRGEAILGPPCDHPLERLIERAADARAAGGQRRSIRLLVGDHAGHRRLAGKERTCGGEIPERGPERVDVGADIGTAGVECLLGRHEVNRAEHLSGDGKLLAHRVAVVEAGQSQVEDPHPPFGVEHEVGRLDVAVDDAALVRVREAGGGLSHPLDDVVDRLRAGFLDELGERAALDEVHHEVVRAMGFTALDRTDDVRVVERGRGPELAFEPSHGAAIAERRRIDDLQRHDPSVATMLGTVDAAHATAAHLRLDDVGTDDEAGGMARRRLLRLVGREPAVGHEPCGEGGGVGGGRPEIVLELREIEDPAGIDALYEFGEAHRHGANRLLARAVASPRLRQGPGRRTGVSGGRDPA